MTVVARCRLLAGAALVAVGAPALSQDVRTMAQIAAMQAQIDAMQKQLDELKALQARPVAPTPASAATVMPPVAVAWKGAPEFSEGDWKFKVRGRLQYDAAYVENPNETTLGVATLGFNSRVRRARLGVEGAMPGGFAYKLEADVANNAIGYGDLTLAYAPSGQSFSVAIGNFDTYQSLEQPTSSRFINFLERAQMNEAFDHTRRLGIGLGYASGDFRANAGIFNDRIRADNAVSGSGEGAFGNRDLLLAARAVWSPELLGGRLHFGASYQHREFDKDDLGLDYRTRPFVQTTDQRFVGSGTIAAHGDAVIGVEAAGIFGPLHVVGEAQRVKVKALRPGDTLGLDEVATGNRFIGDPEFWSYYLEAGYWLTGETRGYRGGLWDRTKVKRGFDRGGWGAVGVNARYDVLDLRDRVAAGTAITAFSAPNFIDGGKQVGYLLSLVWQPIDFVRFTAQYTRAEIEGGPRAATVVPVSGNPVFDRDYGLDVLALRAAFDF